MLVINLILGIILLLYKLIILVLFFKFSSDLEGNQIRRVDRKSIQLKTEELWVLKNSKLKILI